MLTKIRIRLSKMWARLRYGPEICDSVQSFEKWQTGFGWKPTAFDDLRPGDLARPTSDRKTFRVGTMPRPLLVGRSWVMGVRADPMDFKEMVIIDAYQRHGSP